MTCTTYRRQNYDMLNKAISRGLESELFAISEGSLMYEGVCGEMVSVPYREYGFELPELLTYLWQLDGEGKLEVIDPESKRLFIIPRYS